MATPTVRRKQLGNELRHLRERARVGDQQAATEALGRTQATLSRIESGVTGIRATELRRLVEYYAGRIDGEVDLDGLLELARGAETRGRWSGYRASFAKHFRMAVDLETDAETIHTYQTELIWGPLQTENYMRALFAAGKVQSGDRSVEDAIAARLERRAVLSGQQGAQVTVVLSESAIRRKIGSDEVMHEQLVDLVEMSQRPNLHLHILPFDCRTAVTVMFPFVYYRVPPYNTTSPALEFVYVEQYHNADYLDGANDVTAYDALWSGLLGAALDPAASRTKLITLVKLY